MPARSRIEGSGLLCGPLADVPGRRQDLVAGRYELPAPKAGTQVAVKIIDMLGEEWIQVFDV